MAALTQNRNTPERDGRECGFVAAAVMYQGALVALDAEGKAIPASASTGSPVGVARNPATAGETVIARRGVFALGNSVDDTVTRAQIGTICHVADDQTVKQSAGSPAAPTAGVVMDVDERGVWVKI